MDIKKKQIMYLDWVNNFLTVDRFADHYGISREEAEQLIADAKKEEFRAKLKKLLDDYDAEIWEADGNIKISYVSKKGYLVGEGEEKWPTISSWELR